MTHNICRECETVAHCSVHGCIPVQTPKHWSDCAVHSEPAYPAGECDCGGYFPEKNAQTLLEEIAHIVRTTHLYGPEMAKLLAQEAALRQATGESK